MPFPPAGRSDLPTGVSVRLKSLEAADPARWTRSGTQSRHFSGSMLFVSYEFYHMLFVGLLIPGLIGSFWRFLLLGFFSSLYQVLRAPWFLQSTPPSARRAPRASARCRSPRRNTRPEARRRAAGPSARRDPTASRRANLHRSPGTVRPLSDRPSETEEVRGARPFLHQPEVSPGEGS